MLPIKYRLKKSSDFQRVYKQGKFFSLNGISLTFAKNDSLDIRIGFVVSKRFSKKAVERNKAKRLLRESIAKNVSNLNPGIDIVVGYQAKKTPLVFENVSETINLLIKKAKILK